MALPQTGDGGGKGGSGRSVFKFCTISWVRRWRELADEEIRALLVFADFTSSDGTRPDAVATDGVYPEGSVLYDFAMPGFLAPPGR